MSGLSLCTGRNEEGLKESGGEFITTFHNPLSAHAIDAMSVIFNLDDKNSGLLDQALLQHVGIAVVDVTPLKEEA